MNNKIRARQVRVVGVDGKQLGVYGLGDALQMARQNGVDLVEVAPSANPPVCRLINFGKYRYEQAKKEKESKKHQHANKIKEIQLSPVIDPHDFEVKTAHAVDFLCEEMKVKGVLRFKGRQMAHKEVGHKVVERFIQELQPYGQPDSPPRMVGRAINVVISPLPRQKRAENPRGHTIPHDEDGAEEGSAEWEGDETEAEAETEHPNSEETTTPEADDKKPRKGRVNTNSSYHQARLNENPFAELESGEEEDEESTESSSSRDQG